jgi:hypothetical protein
MSVILKINSKTKSETIQKAHTKMRAKKLRKSKTIADFFGTLPTTFEDGLTYQKKQRNEW